MAAQMRESFLHELMILQSPPSAQNTEAQTVDITFLSDSGSSTGHILSGSFVACDTKLTHLILNGLNTPIGMQSSALVRINDVISITYC